MSYQHFHNQHEAKFYKVCLYCGIITFIEIPVEEYKLASLVNFCQTGKFLDEV